MNIKNVLATLLPSFETVNMKNGLKSNTDALSLLLPQWQNLQSMTGSVEGKTFHSESVRDLSETITKQLTSYGLVINNLRKPSFLEYMSGVTENAIALRPFLTDCIDKDIGAKGLSTAALSFNKQTILQLLDMIEFFTGYSGILLNYVTAQELAAVPDSNIDIKGIGPNDLTYLKANLVPFTIAARTLGTPLTKLKADYGQIPEAIFDADTYEELSQTFGREKTDPLGMSGFPFPISIMYRVRMNQGERQMDHYDEIVADTKAAELRALLYKKQLAEGNGDAAIEILLEKQEKRIEELKYKRERLEKKLKLA